MSIRARVTLFGIGVVAVVLAVVSALFFLLLAATVPVDQDERLADRATRAVGSVAEAEPGALSAGPALTPADLATSDEIVVVVLDQAGGVISSTGMVGGAPPAIPAGLLARASERGAVTETIDVAGIRLRAHARPWQRADVGRTGYVVTAQTIRRLRSDTQFLFGFILISDIVSLGVAAVAIWFAVGRALRPLRDLTVTVDEIGRATDLARRLPPVRQRDDVGRLTASFNAMMERLQQAHHWMAGALAAQRRFTADASHELRTPLTSVRGNVGFLRSHPDAAATDRESALADLESQSARMSRLVDDLLTLARADGGQQPHRTDVDLGELSAEVCRQAAALHPDRQVHCAGAPVPLHGDEELLRRLVWILVDNALAYTADGGNVWVAATRHAAGVTLQVDDDGPGIPPELRERVFDRFFRADPARDKGGSGLGLSIAGWIVAAHGGHISAGGNARGGASFVAEFPAAVPSSESSSDS
ncbi:MAG TPA: HAMP domain-containing sensor histidine kinase [Pilimelia sp.]|nr:HAMP domain-containing sensor histidine kinase [Pilimelia sp.]